VKKTFVGSDFNCVTQLCLQQKR